MRFDTWLLFSGAAFALAMAPGPNNLLAMFNGARHGVWAAAMGGMGRMGAYVVMIAIAATGLGVVLAASELAFTLIKWGGAAYLVYLGLKSWFAKTATVAATLPAGVSTDDLAVAPDMTIATQGAGGVTATAAMAGFSVYPGALSLARSEFFTAMGNPKVILIFTAFFPQFLDPSQDYASQFVLMGATFMVLEAIVLMSYGLIGGQVKGFIRSARHMRVLNRISGGLLIAAGILLALTDRARAA